ncbi:MULTISPECIES: FtsW/RodA/SpoVE family cell cycle protein [unclassified Niallia]|uniref:FtsW/RodA/SpoVE family cell cycle protein n=1 Tax=unclassified Niallia TaxID=2837522 RepID=UPI0030FAFF5B
MKSKNYYDFYLLAIIIMLMIISIISIYSAQKILPYNSNFAMQQAIWYVIGFIITSIIYYFDFEQIKKISPYLYIFGILLLIILFIAPSSIAPNIKGTKAWFVLPKIGSLQPAEFMKVFLIIFLAKISVDHNNKTINKTTKTDLILVLKILGITSIPLLFILLQPDAGTAMVIITIMFGIIVASGVNWKILISFFSIVLLGIGTLIIIYIYTPNTLLLFLSQYQLDRIHSWLDPFQFRQGIGYQLTQSILAIGSGTTYGKGFFKSQVDVPESHSDFIFSVIAEEYGFLGASLVISLYFLLIYRIVVIVLVNKGEYESIIASGVIAMLTFHIFENVGMVTGLVPITGIPLPLLSYGGSSILGTLLALTLILNISAKTKHYLFGENSK